MLVLTFLYFAAILILSIYGFHRSSMIWHLLRYGTRQPARKSCPGFRPRLCVQVPLYNEAAVARRVLQAVSGLRYPRHLLEIQILDDSTDETIRIIDETLLELQEQQVPIRVIRREERADFKAGALRAGMLLSNADCFAIFDADFVPPQDFLLRTVPFLADPSVAFVQTRWGFLNRSCSFLTRAQALLIDGHFSVEHASRSRRAFFNFNGTAGIWRRSAIEDAGGWQGDTVTEDLDLSYRAFLNGWQAVYLEEVVCSGELPESLTAYRTQQYRWMKGAAQVCRKLLPAILSSRWSTREKVEAFFHLTAPFCYVLMILIALLLVPVTWHRADSTPGIGTWFELIIFLFTFVSLFCFYGCAALRQKRRVQISEVALAIVLGIGMAAHCAPASLVGLFRQRGTFIRTVKTGDIRGREGGVCSLRSVLLCRKELGMVLYLAAGAFYLAVSHLWQSIPFVLLILSGYAAVLYAAARTEPSV